MPALAELFADSFAAGVNRMVVHGFAFAAGGYYRTTWPGYTPFAYEFTEMWNPRQPAWSHFGDTLRWAARHSWVLQLGTPKLDLAFYDHRVPWSTAAGETYPGEDLNALGT